MNLWLRSQDKKTLLKASRIDVIETDIMCYFGYEYEEVYIATYNSKERALEVLDEIQTEISNYVGTVAQIVYQMPKE